MTDYDYVDEDGEPVYDWELYERFDEMLNDVYGEVKIGYSSFLPSDILRDLEPISYRVGFSDFLEFRDGRRAAIRGLMIFPLPTGDVGWLWCTIRTTTRRRKS